MFKIQHEQAR